MRKTATALICMGLSGTGSAFAEDCVDFITASKQVRTQVSSQSEVEKSIDAFCDEYSKTTSGKRSSNFGAAYEALSLSFGSSDASESAIYSKYCSVSARERNSDDKYALYLETIAPEAYDAVKACISLKKKRGISISPTQIGPNNLQFIIKNGPSNTHTASLIKSPSPDVQCAWETVEASGSTNTSTSTSTSTSAGGKLDLGANQSITLNCSRPARNVLSWVTVFDSDAVDESSLSFKWGAYNASGELLDTVGALQRHIDSLWDNLTGAVIPFDAQKCPNGWQEYQPAYGRFIRGIDRPGTTDAQGSRLVGSFQDDDIKAHSHDVSLPRRWGDKYQGYGHEEEPGWGNDNGFRSPLTAKTAEAGGKETRPKNVALLYCKKL